MLSPLQVISKHGLLSNEANTKSESSRINADCDCSLRCGKLDVIQAPNGIEKSWHVTCCSCGSGIKDHGALAEKSSRE